VNSGFNRVCHDSYDLIYQIAPMDAPRVFFQSAAIADHLRCIALFMSQRTCVRLLRAERIASAQFTAAAFRLSGRGVF
jgi:hypothetical protein